MHRAFVGIGSNIDPEQNLPAAIELLASHGEILAVSRVYETAPVGFTDQADFLNAAVLVATELSPEQFLSDVVGEIETRLGRVRDPENKMGPRTIDLDLALFDDLVGEYAGRTLPDGDIFRYAFLAIPLAELDPDYRHPTDGRTLAEIAASFENRLDGMVLRDDVDLRS
ncbi:2-amino-4-hydroxy-6-hydroxymethyldihydropteridine diphosphokinase [Stratiformator vulcanicus]|uniref:2-amino-4-hydroxy-6- hydroxymethyldihydropteridine diphosphokinase n=1 Tax=Stratiformator vulcanicus TaxID=2527980 RepID=UPI002877A5AA|nr:2-amino-4-hydroxy-6-hydroxymethyldihydropteridine diphosphokinase [Stratiformator vulcanicus]